ncbi:ATP-binding protein [Histophilus somni]|uniref:ATP-binding protein n=1 Tax=Histophilus somni TaxID=731 RepID=UPI00201F3182|nr:ATP-binding protein [Histophilus somni]
MSVKNSIITTLKKAFTIGLLFMSMISIIGLFSWYQQVRQVNYLLDDYLSQIHLQRRLEEHIGLFINDLNKFSLLDQAKFQPQFFRQLNQQLNDIETMVDQFLKQDPLQPLHFPLKELRYLIKAIDRQIDENLAIEQKKQEILTKIHWLSDDFNNEALDLIQELSLQQFSFTRQPDSVTKQVLHDELQSIYYFSYQESQLKNELLNFIYHLDKTDISEFSLLQKRFDSMFRHLPKASYGDMMILEQILHTLLKLVQNDEAFGKLVEQIKNHQHQTQQLHQRRDNLISDVNRHLLHALEQKKETLNQYHQTVKSQTHLLSGLTFGLFTLCLLLVWGFSRFYLKRRLANRFSRLIQTVEKLNKGEFQQQIQLSGNDELAQISTLLQEYIRIVQERVKMAQTLQQTQNELIQAGKLAIVGQTITTIAHEINQPLNAISIYLYTLKKWVQQKDWKQAGEDIEKITVLVERINNIIKQLRFFTRRSDTPLRLQNIELVTAIKNVWQLLEPRHQSLNARLHITGSGKVLADGLLLEQVITNLIVNALEAKDTAPPSIMINITETQSVISVEISDNGKGWQLEDPSKLMQPFHSGKAVGLGLGLSLCQHIMTRFGGSIYLASTLSRHALVILEFRKPTC